MTALDTWGAPLLLLIAFANAIPFLSYLIPAEPAFAFAGTRIASGSGWSWLLAAYLGAWCGCQCSFWIGRLAGTRFVDRIGAEGGVIGRIRSLYQRRGAFMVVIAQTIAPISTLAQAMAGVFGMNPRTYALISLLGAGIEVGQYALIGYLGATVLAAAGSLCRAHRPSPLATDQSSPDRDPTRGAFGRSRMVAQPGRSPR